MTSSRLTCLRVDRQKRSLGAGMVRMLLQSHILLAFLVTVYLASLGATVEGRVPSRGGWSNGDTTCVFYPNFNLTAPDFKAKMAVSSSQQCCEECGRTPGCQAAVFDSDFNCRFKNVSTSKRVRSLGGTVCGVIRPSTPSPQTPSGPNPTLSPNQPTELEVVRSTECEWSETCARQTDNSCLTKAYTAGQCYHDSITNMSTLYVCNSASNSLVKYQFAGANSNCTLSGGSNDTSTSSSSEGGGVIREQYWLKECARPYNGGDFLEYECNQEITNPGSVIQRTVCGTSCASSQCMMDFYSSGNCSTATEGFAAFLPVGWQGSVLPQCYPSFITFAFFENVTDCGASALPPPFPGSSPFYLSLAEPNNQCFPNPDSDWVTTICTYGNS